jgi:Flp pilus assembly protein TadB
VNSITIVVAAIAAVAILLTPWDRLVRCRLGCLRPASANLHCGDKKDKPRALPDARLEQRMASLNRVVEQRDFGANLAREIARADLKLKPSEFLGIWAASTVGLPLAFYIVGFVMPSFQTIIALIGALVLGFILPRIWLARRKSSRLSAFNKQLPTRSRWWPTRSAQGRRSSRPSSSSSANHGPRSRSSSRGSSARSTWACPSTRPWRTWSAASGRTTSS